MNNELIRSEPIPPSLFGYESGQRLSGREILDTLFRQKWRILLLWMLVLAATLGYIFVTPYQFESEMTILVKDKRVDLSPGSGERTENGASDVQVATEIQLLGSTELFRLVAIKSGLASKDSSEQLDQAVTRLRRTVRISPVLKSSLIQVKYSDTNPKRCAHVLKMLLESYMDTHLQLQSSPGSYEFFTRQAVEYETKLKDAHDRLLSFQSKANIVSLAEQKDLTLRKLLETESALRDALAQKVENELRIGKLREQMAVMGGRITTQMRKIPNQYSVERLNTLLTELQNRRTELLTKFRPEDRTIKQLDQQIVDTRIARDNAGKVSSTEEASDVNPIRQVMEADLGKADVNLSGLSARIDSLTTQTAELRGTLTRLQSAGPSDDVLLREVAVAEQNFLLYSKKREEARIAQEMDRQKIANVVMVDPPRVPTMPKSKLGSGVPAAFLLGSMLAVALCFAVGHRRNVVYTPWELETATGLPVLATIPMNGKSFLPAMPRRSPVLQLEGHIENE